MASISTRTNARGETTWRVSFYEGSKLRWTPTLYTAAGAVEMKALIEERGHETALAILAKRRGATPATALLRDVFEDYLRSLGSHAARGTAPEYRRVAERTWLPDLGPLPVDAIDRGAVERWVARQRTTETHRSVTAREKARERNRTERTRTPLPPVRTYSAKSIKNAHTVLSQTLAYALARGDVRSNPAHGVKLPSDEQATERDIFTREEFTAFLAVMQPTYRALTAFLVVTGCRIGEATAVQVRDLDLGAPTVTIRRAWKKGETTGDGSRYLGSPKSRRGNRTIVLPPTLAAWLELLVEGRAAEDAVFRAARGGTVRPANFSQRQFPTALRRAGITKHLTPHSLRHTSASWLLMDGQPAQVVQHRLGHESLDTTSRTYAHLLQDAQVPAAAFMAQVIPPTLPALPAREDDPSARAITDTVV